MREDLLFYVDEVISATGISESQISLEATGNRSFVANIRKGRFAAPRNYDRVIAWLDAVVDRVEASARSERKNGRSRKK